MARFPAWIEPEKLMPQQWNLFWLLIGGLVAHRCVRAILDPQARLVQLAVRNCLMSLIVIDAAIVLGMAGSGLGLRDSRAVGSGDVFGPLDFGDLASGPRAACLASIPRFTAIDAKRLQIDDPALAENQTAHHVGSAGRKLQTEPAVAGGQKGIVVARNAAQKRTPVGRDRSQTGPGPLGPRRGQGGNERDREIDQLAMAATAVVPRLKPTSSSVDPTNTRPSPRGTR